MEKGPRCQLIINQAKHAGISIQFRSFCKFAYLPREEEREWQGDEAVVVVPGVRLAHRHLAALVHPPLPRSLPYERTSSVPPVTTYSTIQSLTMNLAKL